MKGKDKFSESEASQIRKLIKQKMTASSNEQKNIRNKIRCLNFHFSDFSDKKGYTVEDFDQLIKSGQINIKGNDTLLRKEPQEHRNENLKLENLQSNSVEERIFDIQNFKTYPELNKEILKHTGFYCIKLKEESKLPEKYQIILDKRKLKYIYIGKAEGQSLKERLAQEIEHKSPGTFFRSIGCVLQYVPITGHLRGKSNQNNYKFSPSDTEEIIEWLKSNIEISIIESIGNFAIEKKLIKKYCPLLNDTHNLMKLQELRDDKDNCRKIARG